MALNKNRNVTTSIGRILITTTTLMVMMTMTFWVHLPPCNIDVVYYSHVFVFYANIN